MNLSSGQFLGDILQCREGPGLRTLVTRSGRSWVGTCHSPCV